jgi:dTDP-4-dehydrorhamnose 3,5-epimerase
VILRETELRGAFVIEPELKRDERGWFAVTFERGEFEARGLDSRVQQVALSHNARRGTLRGLHFQEAPHAQPKLVRVARGAIHDVIVDLRAGSPTLRKWTAVELRGDDHRALYVPAGFAHGFQTLEDETLVVYQIGAPHVPAAERGIPYDDPALAIAWPLPVSVISQRDASFLRLS